MKTQNQIKRTLSRPAEAAYIRWLLESNPDFHRSDIAGAVCERFGLYDARGRPQISGTLKALRQLEAAGHFVLPAARAKTGPSSPRGLTDAVEPPRDVPAQAGDVQGLRLVVVKTDEEMRTWNELMKREHPQGACVFVGRQLRYLIDSDHGCLGGVGFAASALQLSARDRWIGWDREQRRAYLDRVVGMSRFLIRPSVHCRNLATRVLSMTMAAVPDDFERRYNYRPWLVESFVDTSHYSGACYKAGNWIRVGRSRGRGRQDRFNQQALSEKDIYLYPLDGEFRKQMGLSPDAGLGGGHAGRRCYYDTFGHHFDHCLLHHGGCDPPSDAGFSCRAGRGEGPLRHIYRNIWHLGLLVLHVRWILHPLLHAGGLWRKLGTHVDRSHGQHGFQGLGKRKEAVPLGARLADPVSDSVPGLCLGHTQAGEDDHLRRLHQRAHAPVFRRLHGDPGPAHRQAHSLQHVFQRHALDNHTHRHSLYLRQHRQPHRKTVV